MSEIIDLNSDLYSGHGKDAIMHQLAKMGGFKEPVPSIEQFIDDPYYLGKSLGQGLYPIWREAAKELYPTPYYSPYQEIVLTGAIGLGKSTMSLLITLYDVCRMLSLENPHKHYNLIESTVISFALMNATKGLAGSVLYAQIIEWIEASPYFKSKLSPKNHNRSLFINNIDITMGSRGRDMLGQATAGAIFSEINDMNVVGNQAQDNFDTIATRRESRFGGKGAGKEILGHLILDSSNKGARSFIDDRIEDKRRNNINDFKIFSFSHWKAKWFLGNYSGEFFRVYAGNETIDPFIVTEDKEEIVKKLDGSRLIDVPIEHREAFESNIIKSLGDLAGVSTFSTFSYITSNEIITKVFNRFNIVTKPLIVLDFFDQNQLLEQFIDLKLSVFINKSPRFIHIDLGLKWDSTGIACTYQDGYAEINRFDPLTGLQTIDRSPRFVTEWVMEIRAIPGQEVPIYKIRDFILTAKRIGYPVHTVSTDGFQSSNLRQDLKLKGINTELISVDRTKDPYSLMRNAMLEGRVDAPNVDKLIKEVKELQENDDKYDHPETGSKDIVDAVCGSIWSCSQNIIKSGTVVDSETMMTNMSSMLSSMNGNKLFNTLTGKL